MANRNSIESRADLPHVASKYQIKIFEAIENAVSQIIDGETPRSMLVSATAGSAKTSTAVAAAALIPESFPTIFLAFNKHIAKELVTRLPPSIPAKTFHSYWLRQWTRWLGKRKVNANLNAFKVQNAIDKHFGLTHNRKNGSELKRRREQADMVAFFVEKAKIHGVVPRDYTEAHSVCGYDDNEYFWKYIMERYDHPDIDLKRLDETIEIARKILCGQLDNEAEFDFDDMLWLPAVKGVAGDSFLFVIIDETQDASGLQQILLSRMVAPNGMIMAIGDKRQAIYSFRGADPESMDQIKERFDCTEYPLSISYRCAKRIVELAYDIYPEIESAPDAPPGLVEWPEKWEIDKFMPGHLVVCRTNAPTLGLAYRLLRHRIPVKVLGRDIGKGLIKLITKLDVDGSLTELMVQLRWWRDQQLALIEPANEKAKERIHDKHSCIAQLAACEEIGSVKELLNVIGQLFSADPDEKQMISASRVTLSTIHKSKGLEADTVIILDSHLINPPWVKKEKDIEQEQNLRFVAYTRAKTRLIFINSDAIKT